MLPLFGVSHRFSPISVPVIVLSVSGSSKSKSFGLYLAASAIRVAQRDATGDNTVLPSPHPLLILPSPLPISPLSSCACADMHVGSHRLIDTVNIRVYSSMNGGFAPSPGSAKGMAPSPSPFRLWMKRSASTRSCGTRTAKPVLLYESP